MRFCNKYCNPLKFCNTKVLQYFAILLQYYCNTILLEPPLRASQLQSAGAAEKQEGLPGDAAARRVVRRHPRGCRPRVRKLERLHFTNFRIRPVSGPASLVGLCPSSP